MRTLALITILTILSFNIQAQDKTVKTVTLTVRGNCEECKKRIENAADIKGVKLAVWDENRQAITVTYRTDKVTLEQIEQAIAASGHDAGPEKASQQGYSKLPDCCKYRDKGCKK